MPVGQFADVLLHVAAEGRIGQPRAEALGEARIGRVAGRQVADQPVGQLGVGGGMRGVGGR
ncbi:hypothetical protein, partial [Burkholderia gladioli]